jgi:hypothetical protein
MLHLFLHSALPIMAPVPTGGILLPVSCVFIHETPKAALIMSCGMVQSAISMLVVPVSSLLSVLMRSAGSQSSYSSAPMLTKPQTTRAETGGVSYSPLFCIACMLPIGKTVIFIGVRTVSIVLTPFSPIIHVVVFPVMAVTRFVARGCRCGGNIPHPTSLSMEMVMPWLVRAGKLAASATMTAPFGWLKLGC